MKFCVFEDECKNTQRIYVVDVQSITESLCILENRKYNADFRSWIMTYELKNSVFLGRFGEKHRKAILAAKPHLLLGKLWYREIV